MERHGIMDTRRDLLLPEVRHEGITIPHPDGIDMVYVPAIISLARRSEAVCTREQLRVEPRIASTRFIPCVDMLQLYAQHRTLEAIHSGVPSDHVMVILPRLTVVPEHPNLVCELVVIRHGRTSLSVSTEVFTGIKAETAHIANGACFLPFVLRPMGLGSVFDNVEFALARGLNDRAHVRHLAEKVHGNDGLCPGRDRSLQLCRVHVVGCLLNINKDRPGTAETDCLSRGYECGGNGDHFVAGADTHRNERCPERFRAASDTDGMLRPAEGGEFFLKLGHERPAREGSVF